MPPTRIYLSRHAQLPWRPGLRRRWPLLAVVGLDAVHAREAVGDDVPGGARPWETNRSPPGVPSATMLPAAASSTCRRDGRTGRAGRPCAVAAADPATPGRPPACGPARCGGRPAPAPPRPPATPPPAPRPGSRCRGGRRRSSPSCGRRRCSGPRRSPCPPPRAFPSAAATCRTSASTGTVGSPAVALRAPDAPALHPDERAVGDCGQRPDRRRPPQGLAHWLRPGAASNAPSATGGAGPPTGTRCAPSVPTSARPRPRQHRRGHEPVRQSTTEPVLSRTTRPSASAQSPDTASTWTPGIRLPYRCPVERQFGQPVRSAHDDHPYSVSGCSPLCWNRERVGWFPGRRASGSVAVPSRGDGVEPLRTPHEQDGPELTDAGRRQAVLVGKVLREIGFDLVLTSPLRRARDG